MGLWISGCKSLPAIFPQRSNLLVIFPTKALGMIVFLLFLTSCAIRTHMHRRILEPIRIVYISRAYILQYRLCLSVTNPFLSRVYTT